MVKSWFNKILPSLGKQHKEEKKSPVPQGLWQTCSNCKEILYGPDLEIPSFSYFLILMLKNLLN